MLKWLWWLNHERLFNMVIVTKIIINLEVIRKSNIHKLWMYKSSFSCVEFSSLEHIFGVIVYQCFVFNSWYVNLYVEYVNFSSKSMQNTFITRLHYDLEIHSQYIYCKAITNIFNSV